MKRHPRFLALLPSNTGQAVQAQLLSLLQCFSLSPQGLDKEVGVLEYILLCRCSESCSLPLLRWQQNPHPTPTPPPCSFSDEAVRWWQVCAEPSYGHPVLSSHTKKTMYPVTPPLTSLNVQQILSDLSGVSLSPNINTTCQKSSNANSHTRQCGLSEKQVPQ